VEFNTTTGTSDGVNVISLVWMLVGTVALEPVTVYCYCKKECWYNLGYYIMNTYTRQLYC
jgi:uncharacterized membrane protein